MTQSTPFSPPVLLPIKNKLTILYTIVGVLFLLMTLVLARQGKFIYFTRADAEGLDPHK